MSLSRTSKTIRSWARNGHVEARKKSTAHGDMWILDKASLLTKIQTEIEYRDQAAAVQTRVNESAPVQTSTDPSEPVQTRSGQPESENGQEQSSYEGSNTSEPGSHGSEQARIRELESEVMTLKIDKGWRDEILKKQAEELSRGQESLHAQARYIGYLEGDLKRLGVTPDQTFLAAPTPKNAKTEPNRVVEPEVVAQQRPHPNQRPFPHGQTG